MRKLMRSVARHNMKLAGYERLNKKGADGKSIFSKHWREFVHVSPRRHGRRTTHK